MEGFYNSPYFTFCFTFGGLPLQPPSSGPPPVSIKTNNGINNNSIIVSDLSNNMVKMQRQRTETKVLVAAIRAV